MSVYVFDDEETTNNANDKLYVLYLRCQVKADPNYDGTIKNVKDGQKYNLNVLTPAQLKHRNGMRNYPSFGYKNGVKNTVDGFTENWSTIKQREDERFPNITQEEIDEFNAEYPHTVEE